MDFCTFQFFGQRFDQKSNPSWLFTRSLILWSNLWIFLKFSLLKWNWTCKESCYAKSPNLTRGWFLVKGLTKKSTRKSTIWLFRFLHEMNRKSLTDARPTDRIKKRRFLFKKQAPLWLKTIILNFLFLMTCRLKIRCQQ